MVTNFHVVKGAAVFVQLDAGKPIEAEPIGGAPEYDLAVLRAGERAQDPAPGAAWLCRATCASARPSRHRQPFGLQRTLTKGLVSALDRELPTANFREVVGVIQTDAAINPGNSGGRCLTAPVG